jgi:hypothetical protein
MLFSPIDGSPAYVGQGNSRDRPFSHLKAARSPRPNVAPIVAQLRHWLAAGYDVPIVTVRDQLHAGQSNDLERRPISIIGRRCLGNGPLWNVLPGEATGEVEIVPRRSINSEAPLNRELRRRNPERVSVVRARRLAQ